MSMNERIDYNNANYLANCSQNLAPYANAPIHNSVSFVTLNSSQIINDNLARCAIGNIHNSASYVALSRGGSRARAARAAARGESM
jgi:hypothetical protein